MFMKIQKAKPPLSKMTAKQPEMTEYGQEQKSKMSFIDNMDNDFQLSC